MSECEICGGQNGTHQEYVFIPPGKRPDGGQKQARLVQYTGKSEPLSDQTITEVKDFLGMMVQASSRTMIQQRLSELFGKEEPCTDEEVLEVVLLFGKLTIEEAVDINRGEEFRQWIGINKRSRGGIEGLISAIRSTRGVEL
jgi:hypothetical protein